MAAAAVQNGYRNGLNGTMVTGSQRFAEIPPAIDITVYEGGDEEDVEVNLTELLDDPTELCTLLENEKVAKNYWMVIALAYAKQDKIDRAIEILSRGLAAFSRGRTDERLSILSALCWMYMWKCRDAPRLRPEAGAATSDVAVVRNKEFYINLATSTLNDASRISPSYPPLFLARGVLSLLRASIQVQSKPGGASGSSQDNSERSETLRQALKCFEDALRASGGKNIMAMLGKARVQVSMGRYAEALHMYQFVLEGAPHLVDPDPRIGVGCCLWQLGHREDAKLAWERALEKNPSSKIANILLGIYHLQYSSQFATSDAEFVESYKKAMTLYTQKAFKLDDKLPLTCSTFGGYFLMRKAWTQVERLARKAIDLTDVNAIASDGWYLLARKEHHNDDYAKANEYYIKADQARGGDDRGGYLPAKFGSAQIRVLMRDYDGAKFRLEKLVQQSKSIEAMTLLGTLYAEDVFSAKIAGMNKEEIASQRKKAITLLEQVRMAWKDPKKKVSVDAAVLLNLARLYELDSPDKSLQCLRQVEQMEIDAIPEDMRPQDIEDEEELGRALRELIPPPLLNNMGCFHYQADKFTQAKDMFQTALNACVKIGEKDPAADTDALVTTISYNLARTYEAEGDLDEARRVYEGLLSQHDGYLDAIARLAYISFQQHPEEGTKAMQEMFDTEPDYLDVRALYGWFLNRTKKRTLNFAEDQEQRHNKHTLINYDKYDPYVLTSMGNICLSIAREMRRDEDKDRRRKMYERAVEFFDRALSLDPRNAYAAQGVGIAMAEDKKDLQTAVQIFSNVRETMKDAIVYMNLGHAFCELRQYTRAIESYEIALAKKDRVSEVSILPCLGRVWLLKGRQEKNLQAMKTALDYSRRALELMPDQVHFQFNVAFVQFQIAQHISTLPSQSRSLVEVQTAIEDLDSAVETLFAVAKAPAPPYPRHDLEQRATMGRNTVRKQLDRALDDQRVYEEKNAERLATAREAMEAEIRKREDAKRVAQEEADERRNRIAEERARMQERDRALAEERAEEERLREEELMTTDTETGERKKRTVKKKTSGKRKKKDTEEEDDLDDDLDDDVDGDAGDLDDVVSDGEGGTIRRPATAAAAAGTGDEGAERERRRHRKKKKRRLEQRAATARKTSKTSKAISKRQSKYKSSELVIDSDEEAEDGVVEEVVADDDERSSSRAASTPASTPAAPVMSDDDEADDDDDDDNEDEIVDRPTRQRKKMTRVIDDDDDEDEEDEAPARVNGNGDVKMKDIDSDEDE